MPYFESFPLWLFIGCLGDKFTSACVKTNESQNQRAAALAPILLGS